MRSERDASVAPVSCRTRARARTGPRRLHRLRRRQALPQDRRAAQDGDPDSQAQPCRNGTHSAAVAQSSSRDRRCAPTAHLGRPLAIDSPARICSTAAARPVHPRMRRPRRRARAGPRGERPARPRASSGRWMGVSRPTALRWPPCKRRFLSPGKSADNRPCAHSGRKRPSSMFSASAEADRHRRGRAAAGCRGVRNLWPQGRGHVCRSDRTGKAMAARAAAGPQRRPAAPSAHPQWRPHHAPAECARRSARRSARQPRCRTRAARRACR